MFITLQVVVEDLKNIELIDNSFTVINLNNILKFFYNILFSENINKN